ncbi:hypothetical protein [uncultured Mucilaginibacter sp.]|uniref:hypothetical protein n=1 Tax=uncultured Mucilaginibacter sp. TaxID=797541 RepID=UPI002606553B|nr:hypothetical protein [uncultured Mucilaginibacter sp.]
MEQTELEEKVMMMEELIQGFLSRMTVIESGTAELLVTFLQQYKATLETIASRIETANKRYDDRKIARQIDELKVIVSHLPKVIPVKTSHHFGAWSKGLIAAIVICFALTSGSVGTALYFYHQNARLGAEADNFWFVRALYPNVSKTIEDKMAQDPALFLQKAQKALEKQQALAIAEAEATQAEKEQKTAQERLKKVKAAK